MQQLPFIWRRRSYCLQGQAETTLLANVVLGGLLLLTTSLGADEVVRGPYLQNGTPTSVVVQWSTDVPTNSRVEYGAAPTSLTDSVEGSPLTTDHIVTLSGLTANTTYYYSVGSSTQVLAGGDSQHFFLTAPEVGTPKPTRVWVLGDSGTADANARAVRDGYQSFTSTTHTDLWLMLGDNAYDVGSQAEYQSAVFDMYPSMLRKSVLWSTLGNHDSASADSANNIGPYFDIFTFATDGSSGGVASGTESYYSFDYANVHFVCLESMSLNTTFRTTMLTWLEQDLASTSQDWIIAFWHHPPYSKGSHDSDNTIESQLPFMREEVLPILEAGGVDLVMSGHSHCYERSFLLDGHYGFSVTLNPAVMILDGGDGSFAGDGAYTKPTLGPAPHEGAVYIVAGSSGKTSGGSLNHPAMFISLRTLGSMVLDFDANRLDVQFVGTAGSVIDEFTLVKSPGPPLEAPTGLLASDTGTSALLDWNDSTGVVGYGVYRTPSGGAYTRIDNVVPADTLLVSQGASWLYDDTGTDLGSAWKEPGYDDFAWSAGSAELGYGDGDETTTLSFGADENDKHPTYYFRHSFMVSDPAAFVDLELHLLRDDGAVVYLNGSEGARSNMPTGAITYTTLASNVEGPPEEATFYTYSLPVERLLAGTNVLAVEIHQAAVTTGDPDVSFNLELLGVAKVPPVSVAVSQYEDTTAQPGVSYDYVVTAVDQIGQESPFSTSVCVVIGAPDAPAGVSAVGLAGQVPLDWADSSECDLAGYNVYTATSPGVPQTTALNGTLLVSSSYTDSSVTPGQTSYYVVTAVDLDGRESVASSEVSATPPGVDLVDPVISGVQATGVTTTGATISWSTDEAADSAVDYGATVAYGSSVSAPALTTSHLLTLSGLTSGQEYHFRVRSTDGSGNSAMGSDGTFVTLMPNQPPVASNGSFATTEDVAVTVVLSASDPDSGPQALAYEVLTPPSQGSLSGTAPDLLYTPAADSNGTDSFTFRVNDGEDISNEATVTLTVDPANDPPVASSQSVATQQDTSLLITLSADDVDSGVLSYTVTSGPGSVSLTGRGSDLRY